ncbi:hypothetical protein, partial [Methylobacterium radiotolerans]|uniref:hypothetical protein n=1 Tax=Methylobacterium radiotolerans TaxID=31998 RepID=UPI001FD92E18
MSGEVGGALLACVEGSGRAVGDSLEGHVERLRGAIDGPMMDLSRALSDRAEAIERTLAETGVPLAESQRARTEELGVQSRASAGLLGAAVEGGAGRTLPGLGEGEARRESGEGARRDGGVRREEVEWYVGASEKRKGQRTESAILMEAAQTK